MPKTRPSSNTAVVALSRRIPELARIRLCVRAGGRCQFDGCNKYLFEHHVTLTEGNFGQFAHIVAFSEDGPRGKGPRPADIHDPANLMLLCPECHTLIDRHPDRFTREALRAYKERNEKRIYHVTGLGPEYKTSILVVKSRIGSQTVTVPGDHIIQAIAPRYPYSKEGLTIDLTQIATGDSFIASACETIKEHVGHYLSAGGEVRKSGHISLFALAPIPMLAFLGRELGNKVPLDLYQRHRDTEDWTWKPKGKAVQFDLRRLRFGASNESAVLLMSLSGKITLGDVPAAISPDTAVYELTLLAGVPNPTFLKTRRQLEAFRVSYQSAIAEIVHDHPGLKFIDLLPAVPAPIAVLCGRECLPKVHPQLRIYDNDRAKGGFIYQLTV